MDLRTWIHEQDGTVEQATARLAARIGVRSPSIRHWIYSVRPVPAEHCLAIQRATEGAVTVHDLRPDVFGRTPDKAA